MQSIIRRWLPYACILAVVFGGIYIILQQTIRQSYNWPQISAANEVSYALKSHKNIDSLLSRYTTPAPIDSSDSTFVIIYDVSGKVVKSGATLDDKTPDVPKGVLFNSDESPSYHAVTWAPKPEVRIAAVVQKVNIGDTVQYVLAGRNLNQPEQLTEYILLICGLAWIAGALGTLVLCALVEPKRRHA